MKDLNEKEFMARLSGDLFSLWRKAVVKQFKLRRLDMKPNVRIYFYYLYFKRYKRAIEIDFVEFAC